MKLRVGDTFTYTENYGLLSQHESKLYQIYEIIGDNIFIKDTTNGIDMGSFERNLIVGLYDIKIHRRKINPNWKNYVSNEKRINECL